MIDSLLSRDLLPDFLLRFGIRRLLGQRIREETSRYQAGPYAADLRQRPLAEQTEAANEQHYEVPTAFFQRCLGPRLKYSSCLFPAGTESLAEGEEIMLGLYLERAQLRDGQRILELGCGWGSLSLWMAEHLPKAKITGVSNSRTQKEYIDAEARRRGLDNLEIITCDINRFEAPAGEFDRVVSVEMFEHLKNYELLFERIARWLKAEGLLFVHIFTHRSLSYHFVPRDDTDWMSRYFFTGGQIPAADLFHHFQRDLELVQQWAVSGKHYARTAELWLQNMDRHKEELLPLLAQTYGRDQAVRWWVYWRVFYLSCAELWGYRGGEEWGVTHYLFRPRKN